MTCGFMTVPLGTLEMHAEQFPDVKVYVCIKFATIQPAPKGTIFGHCGGPGTLSQCGLNLAYQAGPDYNAVGIDQRGLGRSGPTFAVDSCAGDFDGNIWGVLTDPLNEADTRHFLQKQKDRALKCFNDPSFQLPSKDGSEVTPGVKTFNFLQFTGTSHVAEDLNSFRRAIGAKKLSLHGASYGTMIAMAYATMYPGRVDKFILNSPMPPTANSLHIAWDAAYGMEQVWDNFANACDVLPKCPITAPGGTAEAMRLVFESLRTRNVQLPLSDWHSQIILGVKGKHKITAAYASNIFFGFGQQTNLQGLKETLESLEPMYQ